MVFDMLFFEKLVTLAVVIYGTSKLWKIISMGRQLSQLPSGSPRNELMLKKIDSWSLSVCITVITIVIIVAVAYSTPHIQPTSWLFLAHRLAAGVFLLLFLLLRWQHGAKNPNRHRALGYLATVLYLFVVVTGGYYLYIM